MLLVRTLTLGFVIAIAMSGSLAQTRNSTTATPDTDQTLKQLLTEVHELRMALQRASFSSGRFQMLIERLRVEQAHADSLARDLESVRSQLSELQALKPRIEQQIKDSEDSLDRITDPNSHADLESRIKNMKVERARFDPEEERLHGRETNLDNELQSSQAKISELNGQLDALMNELKSP
jgi:chromosome segregation ATPase